MTSAEWEELYWLFLFTGPNILSWCVALFFCFTRRRDNPKGAAYLGLAVLASLTMVFVLGAYIFFRGFPGVRWSPTVNQYVAVTFHALGAIAFWIFVIMAVFARPKHYAQDGDPMFEDDIVR